MSGNMPATKTMTDAETTEVDGNRGADRKIKAAGDQHDHLTKGGKDEIDRLACHIDDVVKGEELVGGKGEDDERSTEKERQDAL